MKARAGRWSVGVVAASMTLAACAQGTGTPGVAADGSSTGAAGVEAFDADAEPGGSLQIMGFGTGDEIGSVRYEAAQAALPEADLSLVEGDLDIQQFLSSMASGNPPALVYANRDQVGTFASRGAIIPLDACIEGEGIDLSQYREQAIDQVTFDDSVYAIPEFNTIMITMANGGLLEQAGLSIEDVNGSDWDAVRSATEQLMAGEGGDLSVIGFDPKMPEFLPLWAHANGVDLLSEDGRTANLDDPAVVEALDFATGLYELQGGFGAVKAYRDSADFFGAGNQFATDVLGAMPMEQWYLNVLNDVSPDAPMAFDTFRTREGEPTAYASGSSWAIPAGTEETQAAACRFMRVMTATDTWLAAAQARADARAESGELFTGLLTGNQEADERIRAELVPTDAPEPWASGITAVYEANDSSFAFPANPADAEFEAAWQDAVNRVLNGQAESQESLEQAQQEAQAALDDAWAAFDEAEG